MANLSRFGGVPRSSIFLSEQAAAQADSAGYGQFWTKSDTPNIPMFTDDAGNDRALVWVESGTFTPTIQDDSLSNGEGQTYTTQSGVYRKIGSCVFFSINIVINSLGTLTTGQNIRIAGLPYAAASAIGGGTVVYAASLALPAAAYSLTAIASVGNAYLTVDKWGSTTGSSGLTVAELSAGGQLIVLGTYFTA